MLRELGSRGSMVDNRSMRDVENEQGKKSRKLYTCQINSTDNRFYFDFMAGEIFHYC